jgi:hypothetical protein
MPQVRVLSPRPKNFLTSKGFYGRMIERFGQAGHKLFAGVAQLVEQLICNQQVGGSSPSTSSTKNFIFGGIPERPKGADCKSVAFQLRWFESIFLHQNNTNLFVVGVIFLQMDSIGAVLENSPGDCFPRDRLLPQQKRIHLPYTEDS